MYVHTCGAGPVYILSCDYKLPAYLHLKSSEDNEHDEYFVLWPITGGLVIFPIKLLMDFLKLSRPEKVFLRSPKRSNKETKTTEAPQAHIHHNMTQSSL